ncbi:hypothetical protein XOC_4625 [Xanthomonas oryzae pv. oryzicola BLS256]|uniref:Uncharacterized protein n=1 Tax=Xanthomonas oryzae pv. oryzicola (strain BLS256) TaxID=383407 RepID=G7TC68_XANOB|nr:hypothetical protein XOC_4625 [Xanthomonas oryzae pv. oryzicola BLS256]
MSETGLTPCAASPSRRRAVQAQTVMQMAAGCLRSGVATHSAQLPR